MLAGLLAKLLDYAEEELVTSGYNGVGSEGRRRYDFPGFRGRGFVRSVASCHVGVQVSTHCFQKKRRDNAFIIIDRPSVHSSSIERKKNGAKFFLTSSKTCIHF